MNYMNPYYELAMKLCGLNPDDDKEFEESEDKVDDILYMKYGIMPDQFESLINDLMPYACVSKSELTESVYEGFADRKRNVWIAKREVKQP